MHHVSRARHVPSTGDGATGLSDDDLIAATYWTMKLTHAVGRNLFSRVLRYQMPNCTEDLARRIYDGCPVDCLSPLVLFSDVAEEFVVEEMPILPCASVVHSAPRSPISLPTLPSEESTSEEFAARQKAPIT